jgi:hypothetical protein
LSDHNHNTGDSIATDSWTTSPSQDNLFFLSFEDVSYYDNILQTDHKVKHCLHCDDDK